MDDLKALKQVLLERAESLFEVRQRNIDWLELNAYLLPEIAKAMYLDGIRDALDYLEHLSTARAEA